VATNKIAKREIYKADRNPPITAREHYFSMFFIPPSRKNNGPSLINFFDRLDVVDISVSFKRSNGIKKAGKL